MEHIVEVQQEDMEDEMQDTLRKLREAMNGRFLQVIIMTHDGNVMSAASADIDEPDEELTRIVGAIFETAVRSAELLPVKYMN